MKTEDYLEMSEYALDAPMTKAVNDTLKQRLVKMHEEHGREQEIENSMLKLKPRQLDNSKQSLLSQRGFYVGDPSLVLRDDILNRGVREGKEIQTGIYTVDGQKMVITYATNGTHAEHDIYSGTISVVPLELTDKNKIKNLLPESLDIRTGSSINLITNQNKLYLAQGNIDEIDTQKLDDTTLENNGAEYSGMPM